MNKSLVLACAAVAIGIGVGTLLTRSTSAAAADEHLDHIASASTSSAVPAPQQLNLPAGEADAMARLTASPRHGEWVTVAAGKNPVTGANDSTRAWIVYPERATKAPVVVVIHEIYGLSPWVRAVADQFAAEGFIAIAPDLITMQNVPGTPVDGPDRQQATAAVRAVPDEALNRQLDAVAKFAMALPAAAQKYGVVGYCWGGTASFKHALHSTTLGAAAVYYGSTPDGELKTVQAPIMGFYGGNDARVTSTVPRADSALKALNRSFTSHVFEGAGHGFLRAQTNEANIEATRKAWPLTVQFFKQHLEGQ